MRLESKHPRDKLKLGQQNADHKGFQARGPLLKFACVLARPPVMGSRLEGVNMDLFMVLGSAYFQCTRKVTVRPNECAWKNDYFVRVEEQLSVGLCEQELSKYFHLPEKAVAKELGICLTSLKKVRVRMLSALQ